MTAVQELSTNHRQSGDTNWSDCPNILRKGTDANAVQGVYETLKTRVGSLSGAPVPEHQSDDAVRLSTKNDKVASGNSRQLHRLVQQGAGNMRLVAGHGQIGPSGQVRRERVQLAQIPKDMDNCGGLADEVEVYTRQGSCWPCD